jgi:N-acetylglucosaminyldiphosphoundecaprenol N-acetyl-beta-D-mannosaminyltransferase
MFLKVPIDIVPPEELPGIIYNLLRRRKKSAAFQNGMDIVLLSLWDLLRARKNNEYLEYLLNAALVIPISKSIVSGVKFLDGKNLIRYMPFKFVITVLTVLEKLGHSLYLFGGSGKVLKKAEKNIRSTFPNLKIVGRCEGTVKKQEEAAVIEAIRKASPSLLLTGKGRRDKELWLHRNASLLGPGLRLWCSDLLDVFAEKTRRPSDAAFEKGLEGIAFCFRNPLKLFRIFPFLGYSFLLLYYKTSRNRSQCGEEKTD